MLKAAHRLRRSVDFTTTVRCGKSARSASVVVHVAMTERQGPVRVGLVVGRAVGGAVVRNTVRRRLRHLMAQRLTALPEGTDVVVRALPRAAGMSSEALSADIDNALGRAFRRARSG